MAKVNTHKLKIGWAITNARSDVPAYRRRFGYYLKQRDISWEVADINKTYDLVVVHHASDITVWKNYNKSKIILDYNDDYLFGEKTKVKDFGRGVAKFIFRQWRKLELDYKEAYTKMMARADAVVCCSDAQAADARQYCKHVYQIADMQSDADWISKKSYDVGSTFNLLWEGLPGFEGLIKLAPILRIFQAKNNSALHMITALKYPKYLRSLFNVHTKDEVARKLNLDKVFLYEWNPYLFSHVATACDLAIIPIDMRIPFWVSKPANKLIFFWRIGMPTLVDPTPAYVKIMDECGLDMVCNTDNEWEAKLELYTKNKEMRRIAGSKAKQFVDEHYSERKLLEKWDTALASVL